MAIARSSENLTSSAVIALPSSDETRDAVAEALRAAADSITARGGATVGDKTMVDALVPFVDAIGPVLSPARLHEASALATAAAAETAALTPKLGRARPLAAKSVGTPDAGATSLALIIETVATHVTDGRDTWRG